MTKNGWGLIGTGRIAEDRVLPAIREHAGNRLVGVVSRDPERAGRFAEKFGAEHAYTSYDDMLRNPEDDKSKNVFDPSIRGRTDRFVYRFRKPKR